MLQCISHSLCRSVEALFFRKIHLQHVLLGERQLGSDLSTAHLAKLVSNVNALGEVLAESEGTEEATGKHVTGTVGVDDLAAVELGHGESLGVGVGRLQVGRGARRRRGSDEGRVGALGDDDETGARGVGLVRVGERSSDLLKRAVLLISITQDVDSQYQQPERTPRLRSRCQ